MTVETDLSKQLKRIHQADKVLGGLASSSRYKASLIFDEKDAADIDAATIRAIALTGLAELELEDPVFGRYQGSLFGEKSKDLDRSLLTPKENAELDTLIKVFLKLLAPHFLQKSAQKCIEYLIRKYRINELNIEAVIACILPYHDSIPFVRMVQILYFRENDKWGFLFDIKKSGQPISRTFLAKRCLVDRSILDFICDIIDWNIDHRAVPSSYGYLINFFAMLCTEYLNLSSAVEPSRVLHLLPLISALSRNKKSVEGNIAGHMLFGSLVRTNCVSTVASDNFLWDSCRVLNEANIQSFLACLLLSIVFVKTQSKVVAPRIFGAIMQVASVEQHLVNFSKLFEAGELIVAFLVASFKSQSKYSEVATILEKVIQNGNINRESAESLAQAFIEHGQQIDSDSFSRLSVIIKRRWPGVLESFGQSALVKRHYNNQKDDESAKKIRSLLSDSVVPESTSESTKIWLQLKSPVWKVRVDAINALFKLPIETIKSDSELIKAYLELFFDDQEEVRLAALNQDSPLLALVSPADLSAELLKVKMKFKSEAVAEQILRILMQYCAYGESRANTLAFIIYYIFTSELHQQKVFDLIRQVVVQSKVRPELIPGLDSIYASFHHLEFKYFSGVLDLLLSLAIKNSSTELERALSCLLTLVPENNENFRVIRAMTCHLLGVRAAHCKDNNLATKIVNLLLLVPQKDIELSDVDPDEFWSIITDESYPAGRLNSSLVYTAWSVSTLVDKEISSQLLRFTLSIPGFTCSQTLLRDLRSSFGDSFVSAICTLIVSDDVVLVASCLSVLSVLSMSSPTIIEKSAIILALTYLAFNSDMQTRKASSDILAQMKLSSEFLAVISNTNQSVKMSSRDALQSLKLSNEAYSSALVATGDDFSERFLSYFSKSSVVNEMRHSLIKVFIKAGYRNSVKLLVKSIVASPTGNVIELLQCLLNSDMSDVLSEVARDVPRSFFASFKVSNDVFLLYAQLCKIDDRVFEIPEWILLKSLESGDAIIQEASLEGFLKGSESGSFRLALQLMKFGFDHKSQYLSEIAFSCFGRCVVKCKKSELAELASKLTEYFVSADSDLLSHVFGGIIQIAELSSDAVYPQLQNILTKCFESLDLIGNINVILEACFAKIIRPLILKESAESVKNLAVIQDLILSCSRLNLNRKIFTMTLLVAAIDAESTLSLKNVFWGVISSHAKFGMTADDCLNMCVKLFGKLNSDNTIAVLQSLIVNISSPSKSAASLENLVIVLRLSLHLIKQGGSSFDVLLPSLSSVAEILTSYNVKQVGISKDTLKTAKKICQNCFSAVQSTIPVDKFVKNYLDSNASENVLNILCMKLEEISEIDASLNDRICTALFNCIKSSSQPEVICAALKSISKLALLAFTEKSVDTCKQILLTLADSSDVTVLVSCLDCFSVLVGKVGFKFIAFLPILMPLTLRRLVDRNPLVNAASRRLLSEIVNANHAQFLSPYLPQLTDALVTEKNGSLVLNSLYEKLELRVSLPSLIGYFDAKKFTTLHSLTVYFELLEHVAGKSNHEAVSANAKALLALFILALDSKLYQKSIRSEFPLFKQSIYNAAVAFAMHMSSSVFKSFFIGIVEWACPSEGIPKAHYRLNALFELSVVMFERLRKVFVPFYAAMLDRIFSILEGIRKSKSFEKYNELWSAIIISLTSFFMWSEDYKMSSEQVVKLLEVLFLQADEDVFNKWEERLNDHLIQCLGNFASWVQKDTMYKMLNSRLLRLGRSDDPRIVIFGLKCTEEIYQRVGENFLTQLPEIVPVLAECLESSNENVEKEARTLISILENLVGEPLDHYFQ